MSSRPSRPARACPPVHAFAQDGSTHVRVDGRLDAASLAHVREVLHSAIDGALEGAAGGDCRRIVVELPEAEIGDASALGLLVGAHHRARRAGRELVVGEVNERTARLLRMSHLDRVLGHGPGRRTVAALTA
jgi:anti-anti-sigma factor